MENTIRTATQEVTAIINNMPVGTIMPFVGTDAKLAALDAKGWLLCNGRRVSKTKYPQLFDTIEYMCGGEGNEFDLPDLQGVFLRGVDSADGAKQRDPDSAERTSQSSGEKIGRRVLSRQSDQFAEHNHNIHIVVHHDNIHMANKPEYWKPAVDVKLENTSNAGGKETRPKNVYVYYIIFAGLPTS